MVKWLKRWRQPDKIEITITPCRLDPGFPIEVKIEINGRTYVQDTIEGLLRSKYNRIYEITPDSVRRV